MKGLHWISVILLIIGGLNWGLIGIFQFNVITTIFGDAAIVTKIIYILIGLSGLWGIFDLFASD